jgi:hypothetical protein
MSGEQLDSDIVGYPRPEATLQLQAAQREIDDQYGLVATMAVDERLNTGRTPHVPPPHRRSFVWSITHVNHG